MINLDDKLISKLSIEWKNSDWNTVIDNKKYFTDEDNYFKYIANNSRRNDLCEVWDIFKNNWKDIQKYLPKGYKLCYICGAIKGSKFNWHLSEHNLTEQDWVDNLTGIPRNLRLCNYCKSNPVGYKFGSYSYKLFCSHHCQVMYKLDKYGPPYSPYSWNDSQIINNGYSGRDDPNYIKLLSRFNKIRSESGKNSVILCGDSRNPQSWTDEQIKNRGYSGRDDPKYMDLLIKRLSDSIKGGLIGGPNSIELYGSSYNPYSWTDEQIKNRGYSGRDDPKYLEWLEWRLNLNISAGKSNVLKNGISNFSSCGYRTKFYLEGNIFNLRSQQELFYLLKLLLIDQIDPLLIDYEVYLPNNTNDYDGIGAFTDFLELRNSKLINHEIHNKLDVDTIKRKEFCSKLNNIEFNLIDLEQFTYPYGSELIKLNQIINLDKLYKDLTNGGVNNSNFKFIFNRSNNEYSR